MSSSPEVLAARVQAIVFDVDGVLTRGDLIYGPDGELKIFSALVNDRPQSYSPLSTRQARRHALVVSEFEDTGHRGIGHIGRARHAVLQLERIPRIALVIESL